MRVRGPTTASAHRERDPGTPAVPISFIWRFRNRLGLRVKDPRHFRFVPEHLPPTSSSPALSNQ